MCIPLSRTAVRWQCASLALCARRDDPYHACAFSCCTTHTRTAPRWRCSPLALRVYTDKILTTDCAHVPAPAHDMHARTAISIRWQCSPLALRARRDSDPIIHAYARAVRFMLASRLGRSTRRSRRTAAELPASQSLCARRWFAARAARSHDKL